MKKTIWYISKYASPPGSEGNARGFCFAEHFVEMGHTAVVIGSYSNHFAHTRKQDWRAFGRGFDKAVFSDVVFLLHKTIRYQKTASLMRILSWFHFEWGLFRLKSSAIPAPSHIIVSSLSLLSVLNGWRLSRKYSARLVFEVRDIWPLTLEIEKGLSPRNPFVYFLRWVERFGYEKADVVVGTMPNLEPHVSSISRRPVRVETIPLGIDPALMSLSPEFRPQNKEKDRLVVGYIGSIGTSNSLQILVKAARQMGPDCGVTFHFWGGGDLFDSLQSQTIHDSHIHFHGPLPRSKVFEAMEKSNVLVFSTEKSRIWEYGQSLNKVQEYMLAGRPIVGAYSGFPSMVNEAECGVFVHPDDSRALVESLLDFRAKSADQLNQLGEKGRSWILQRRTYSRLSEDYVKLLDSSARN